MTVRHMALAVFLAGSSAAAQQANVRVVDRGSGRPLIGALVTLRGRDDSIMVRLLADERGRALVTASAPGTYLIRADAIGFAGQTQRVSLAGAAVAVELALDASPFLLDEVVVTGGRQVCRLDVEQGTTIARIWAEAKKALTATSLTRANRAVQFEVAVFDRELDASGRIITEQRSHKSGPADRPFRAIDPAELHRLGYVQTRDDGTWYHGPDADLLLSEGFLADHCFSLAPIRQQRDLVGLAFNPADHRTLPDVRGVLWLKAATLELAWVEFTFSQVDLPPEARGVGG